MDAYLQGFKAGAAVAHHESRCVIDGALGRGFLIGIAVGAVVTWLVLGGGL